MSCIISGKETKRTFKSHLISKQVLDFAKWYRDKLNLDQKEKVRIAKQVHNISIENESNCYVDLRTCIKTFHEMKSKGYSWYKIQDTLVTELVSKGLLTDEEYKEKCDEIDKTKA